MQLLGIRLEGGTHRFVKGLNFHELERTNNLVCTLQAQKTDRAMYMNNRIFLRMFGFLRNLLLQNESIFGHLKKERNAV